MSDKAPLNSEQMDVVRKYFQSLALFRGEIPLEVDEEMLSIMEPTYESIMREGGDPVRLARMRAHLTARKLDPEGLDPLILKATFLRVR